MAKRAIVDANGRWECRELLADGKPCKRLLGIWQDGMVTIFLDGVTIEVKGHVRRTCETRRHGGITHEMDTADVEVMEAVERHEGVVG